MKISICTIGWNNFLRRILIFNRRGDTKRNLIVKYETLLLLDISEKYFTPVHRSAFCQFPFWWIYYCHSSKSTGKETGKTHVCATVTDLAITCVTPLFRRPQGSQGCLESTVRFCREGEVDFNNSVQLRTINGHTVSQWPIQLIFLSILRFFELSWFWAQF